jgi:hypothetical protein
MNNEWVKKELVEKGAMADSTVIEEWQDAPEEGRTPDDWPYPRKHVKYVLTGPLARAIRAKLGIPWSADAISQQVYIIETTVSDGYSEYTQEESQFIVIKAGGRSFMFGEDYGNRTSAFNSLMEWLDK